MSPKTAAKVKWGIKSYLHIRTQSGVALTRDRCSLCEKFQIDFS